MSSPTATTPPKVRRLQPGTSPTGPIRPLRRPLLQASRLAGRGIIRTGRRLTAIVGRWRARRLLASQPGPLRLGLGSGTAPIPGWLNIDLEGWPELRWDLRLPLPFPEDSGERIYSEHLIEHLSFADGANLLRHCRRVLSEEGVLRIATPDLGALIEAYRGDWQDQDWLHWPGHEWIDSPARMLNQSFHGWGHKFLYDAAELERALHTAGFANTRRCQLGDSEHPELAGLETRPDSRLIFEAWGTQPNHL